MKVSSLLLPFVFAIGLTGAVQATPEQNAGAHIAPATIEVAQCGTSAKSACPLTADIAGQTAGSEVDLDALPSPDPKLSEDQATAVPEPQTFIMLVLGLLMLGVASRRRDTSERFDNLD